MKGLWMITGAPMNFIIGGINKGVSSLLDAINKATGLLKIPAIPAPQIPLIPGPPEHDYIPLSKTAQAKNEAVAMAGGGVVPGNIDKSHYGTAVYRIGQVNPPTLVLSRTSFTSKAAETFGKGGGADYDTFSEDVDMNMPGRTSEVMKYKSGDLIGKETFEEDLD